MKIDGNTIIASAKAIENLNAREDLPARVTHRIGHNARKLRLAVKELMETRQLTYERRARKDEEGNFVPAYTEPTADERKAGKEPEPIKNSLTFDDRDAVEAEIAAMIADDHEVDIHTIDLSMIESFNIPGWIFEQTHFMWAEAPQPVPHQAA